MELKIIAGLLNLFCSFMNYNQAKEEGNIDLSYFGGLQLGIAVCMALLILKEVFFNG